MYFPSQKVGNVELVDGGLLANNPLGWYAFRRSHERASANPDSRLWTEVATVFSAGRSTDCFLSIGTGMPPNAALGDLLGSFNLGFEKSVANLTNFAGGIASAASNSEATNILFRTLLDAYAPRTGEPKYFRLNFEEVDPKTSTKELQNFVQLAEMDDASQDTFKFQEKKTTEWIAKNKTLVDSAANALKRSLP